LGSINIDIFLKIDRQPQVGETMACNNMTIGYGGKVSLIRPRFNKNLFRVRIKRLPAQKWVPNAQCWAKLARMMLQQINIWSGCASKVLTPNLSKGLMCQPVKHTYTITQTAITQLSSLAVQTRHLRKFHCHGYKLLPRQMLFCVSAKFLNGSTSKLENMPKS
jgi:hypothetical protein